MQLREMTTEQRSRLMSRIHSKGTTPERKVGEFLARYGLLDGADFNASDLPGKPDVAWRDLKIAVFVHGCFWHRHDCKTGRPVPKTNTEFWVEKFTRNVARDVCSRNLLLGAGWSVLTIWECQCDGPHLAALALAVAEGMGI